MSKHTSTIRAYLLVGAYGVSIGLLLISAFLAVECFNAGGWLLAHKQQAWIFGLGIGGLVLLSWALIAEARWRRSNLIVRLPFDRHKLLVLSIASATLLIPSLVAGILRVGFSVGTFGLCMLVPFTILLWLFSAVRSALGSRDYAKRARLPLLVNTIAICLVVLLYWANSRFELGFRSRLNGYENVVRLVERGDLKPDDGGFATLPEDYQWLSDGGEIVIIHRGDLTSVIFFSQLGYPGEYYAVAYRSDDSIPENFDDDRCDRGWRVQANIPKWFACVSD